jgi:hypothetical protein
MAKDPYSKCDGEIPYAFLKGTSTLQSFTVPMRRPAWPFTATTHSDLSITHGLLKTIFMACDPTVINASSPAIAPAMKKGKKERGAWYAKVLSHLSEK